MTSSTRLAAMFLFIITLLECSRADSWAMNWVRIAPNHRGFTLDDSGKPFIPWGFNYDHDEVGRLLEDYWNAEWSKVEADFHEMKALGANVVRIHLQLNKFLKDPNHPNQNALEQLGRLLRLAEKLDLYLDVTGLGCYHKQDAPAWYDALAEQERWAVQARFWREIALCCANSPAVFCYDLMNEPVVPGGKRSAGDWLGGAFGGKHFVQFITLDQLGRPRSDIAHRWIQTLVDSIHAVDKRHLVTVGLVDWSLESSGLTSGFVPDRILDDLDFLSVHLYPETGKVNDALKTLKGFALGKPVLIEETFPLRCSTEEFTQFATRSREHATGLIGFYWGKTPEECRRSNTIADSLTLAWLNFFSRENPNSSRHP